ncbi:MAG: glycoside hydrolase family 2 protein [Bacteroidia bacterium]
MFYIFLFITHYLISQVSETTLNASWQFKQKGTEKYYSAIVPGTVHTDLLNNKLIKDPYYSDNEKSVQWIENEDWEYIGTFNFDYITLENKHIELNFEGIDTYAKIYLNNQLILECNNMFRSWNVDVKQYLKLGPNTLRIEFESAVKKGKAEAAKLPYTLPDGEKVFTRKAQYQYGWDWGPCLVTCGIYKPIKLICWNEVKILSINPIIKNLNDTIADIDFVVETKSDSSISGRLNINTYHGEVNIAKLQYNNNYPLKLKKGINTDTFHYSIRNPKLWNSNGLGDAHLYGYDINLKYNNKTINYKNTIGLKTVELVRQKDSIGESFYFKLNGKPVFMKGANYIPQDNFVSRTSVKDYKKIIQLAKEAHMNMLRVWGGGVYADDEFYKECDRNGILVWQDFMFACAMYPGDSTFVENVKQEATEQVTRLRNHTCIALWCGNNEVDEGWRNWGWQKQFNYSKTDSAKIWNDYLNLFHNVIPNVISKLCPPLEGAGGGIYHPSSPMIGWGKKESLLGGDSHYWGVWWGMEPFEVYEKKVGRFMSEYGFQGMPNYLTLKHYGDSLDLNSSYIKSHQKHPTGYQTINTYMERDYNLSKDFSKYVYTSQLLQRDGMQIAIESHRRNKPYCMGTLYWQWNDCWPVTSWSAIDYDYRPKALYYATKKLYSNFCISLTKSKGQYQIYVISDSIKNIAADLEIKLKNTKGKILLSKTKPIIIKENSSEILEYISDEELMPFNKNEIYLNCKLIMNGKIIAHKNYFFVKPKELLLHKPNIQISNTKNVIKITSDVFVKDLYLYNNLGDLQLSNNYFDVEPNETIEVETKLGIELLKQIQYISLYDINH